MGMAYNQMKSRMLMLNGVGMGDSEMKKAQLIKRLTNKGHNFQVMAVNCLREFLTDARIQEENDRLQAERDLKEKDRILRRIMDTNARFMGMGFRQALQFTVAAREAEIRLMQRQRGIMNRMVDSNARLMSAGYNKLIEEWKAKQGALKDRLKFVIAALTDYNALKQRMLMLNGVGFADDAAQKLKIRLLRKLTDTSHNLQVMGVIAVREFLKDARIQEENDRAEFERQQKEKDRILKRIINTSARFMGMGFRQALQHTVAATVCCRACLKPIPMNLALVLMILLRILSFSFCCLSNSALSFSSWILASFKNSLTAMTPITWRLWLVSVNFLINLILSF